MTGLFNGSRAVAAWVLAALLLVGALAATHADEGFEVDMLSLWDAAQDGDIEATYRLGRYYERRYWLAEREPEIRGNPADLVLAYALFSRGERSSDRLDALYGRNETEYRLNQILGAERTAIALAALPHWLQPPDPSPAREGRVSSPVSAEAASGGAPEPPEPEAGSPGRPGSALEPELELQPEIDLKVQATAGARHPEVQLLLEKGASFLDAGDPVSARGFFRSAAQHGSGEAAMLVAMTYDPQYLEPLGIVGLRPDIKRARSWYLKALELGHTGAQPLIERLDDLQARSRR